MLPDSPSNPRYVATAPDDSSRRMSPDDAMSAEATWVWRKPGKRLGWVVAIALAVALIIIVAAVARLLSRDDPEGQAGESADSGLAAPAPPVIPSSAPPTASSPAVPPPAAAPSTVRLDDLPSAPPSTETTGLLRLRGKGTRLVVDGKTVTVPARVPCGTHTVKVGKQRPQRVDVPCGGDVTVGR